MYGLPASDIVVTPTDAVNSLLEYMIKQGTDQEKIFAVLLGCRGTDVGGIANAQEAERELKAKGIPVTNNLTRTSSNMTAIVSPSLITVEFESNPYEGVSVRKVGIELPMHKKYKKTA